MKAGKAADYHILVRMIRDVKVPRDRFRCVLVVFKFSTSRRCSRIRSPSRLPVSPMYNFLQRAASYAIDDIC